MASSSTRSEQDAIILPTVNELHLAIGDGAVLFMMLQPTLQSCLLLVDRQKWKMVDFLDHFTAFDHAAREQEVFT